MTSLLRHSLFFLLVAFGATAFVDAQQPNQPGLAAMAINGASGPTYPIRGVPLSAGLEQRVSICGVQNMPFLTFAAFGVLPSGVTTPFGLADIDPTTATLLWDGTRDIRYQTDGWGDFSALIVLPANTAPNYVTAHQTLMADPVSAAGATLTAATESVSSSPLTVLNLTLPNNGFLFFDLSVYGLSFNFYSQTHTSLFVNSDGNLTFFSGSTDFTPSPLEMHAQRPRIAPYWCDLEPARAGDVRVIIDAAGANPSVRVDWIDLPLWNNIGRRHNFSAVLETSTAAIRLIQDPCNAWEGLYTTLVGIGPGQGLRPSGMTGVSPQSDLSTFGTPGPYVGSANEALFEWFGLTTHVYYQAALGDNPFDLEGMTLEFTPNLPGDPSQGYSARTF